jgi:hypothetical protein
MHPDEELAYAATHGTIPDSIEYQVSLRDNQAPLWFITFTAWRDVIGDGEYTSRVLGVLLTLLALSIVFRMMQREASTTMAALSLLLLIGNGLFFQFALDIRPYPMVMTTAAFFIWRTQIWLRRQTRQTALLLGVAVAALLYTHYLLVFLIIAIALYALIAQRWTRRFILQGILAGAAGVLLFLPWLPVFLNQMRHLQNINAQAGAERGAAGVSASTLPTTWENIGRLIDTAANGLWWLYLILLLAGLVLLWRKRMFWLALTWGILTPAIYLLANLFVSVYAVRYVAFASIGVALALSMALVALSQQIEKRWQPAALSILLLGVIGANLLAFPSQIPQRIPYRDLYTQVSLQAHPGDILLMIPAPYIEGFLTWQMEHYLAPELRDNIFTSSEVAAINHRRIWFVTNNWFNEDVQRSFQALEVTHPLQTVLGDCNRWWCYLLQLMEAPPAETAQVFGEQLGFLGVDVDQVGRDGIALRLWWRADAAVVLDYSIGVQMLDSSGALVAQSDGPIQHYGSEVVQTSAMQPGKLYIDWRTLTPAAPLPPGDYTLHVIVYQSWDSVRLTLDGGADSFVLPALVVN